MSEKKREFIVIPGGKDWEKGVKKIKSYFGLTDEEFAVLKKYFKDEGLAKVMASPEESVKDKGPWGILTRLYGLVTTLEKQDPNFTSLYTKVSGKAKKSQ